MLKNIGIILLIISAVVILLSLRYEFDKWIIISAYSVVVISSIVNERFLPKKRNNEKDN